MKFNPDAHRRRSVRLRGWDYASHGAYFVTVCAHGRECVFGEVRGGRVALNGVGKIVESAWNDLPRHYPRVELDAFVVMPNHVHGIIMLTGDRRRPSVSVGAGLKPAPTDAKPSPRHPLSEIVRAFKTFSSRRVNALRESPGLPLWQRNYYEHIIRDEGEMDRMREYVLHNPVKWAEDENHPGNGL